MARVPAELAVIRSGFGARVRAGDGSGLVVRVGVVCPYSFAVPGGVQGQVSGLARALHHIGLEVFVIAPGSASAQGSEDEVRTILVGGTLSVPANGSRAPVALHPRTIWRTRSAIAAMHPDIVHVHEPFVPGPSLAALFCRPAGIVATFHRAGSSRAYRAIAPLARRLVSRVGDCVAVSEAARDTLVSVIGASAKDIEILPNGVDVERFTTAVAWCNDRPTIVFVGRHEQRKGLAVLLEAFSGLREDIRLTVIGAGPETAALSARYRNDARIEWCGALDDLAVASRIAGADVLVAPSLGGESFGVVLLEAMAAGTAVIASDIPGYRLAAGDAVAFVPPNDPAALRVQLALLLHDDEGRTALVERGRYRAEGHAFAALARCYIEHYEALIQSAGASSRHRLAD